MIRVPTVALRPTRRPNERGANSCWITSSGSDTMFPTDNPTMTLPTYRATALLGITSITARPAACQTAACPKPGVECRSAIGASRSLPGAAIKVCLLNRLPTLDLAGGDYPSCPFAVTAQSQPPTLSGRESCHSFHAIGWASHGNADAIVNEYSLSNRCTTAALRRAF